jgi:hypothetical protein
MARELVVSTNKAGIAFSMKVATVAGGASSFLSIGSEVRFIQPLLTRWTLCHLRR